MEETDYQQEPMHDLDGPEYYGQRAHSPKFNKHSSGSSKKKWILIGVIAGAVVLGGAGTAIFLLMHKHGKSVASQQTTTTTSGGSQQSGTTPTGTQSNGNTNTFKSTTLNLAVSYPKAWSLRESSDKQELILTSPQVTYTKKDGSSANGVFTLKLRNGIIPDAIKNTVNSATATMDSQVIAYAQPTSAQRQYTNLSYLGSDANNTSFLMVTGSIAFKAGQLSGGSVDLNGQAYLFAGGYGADSGDTLAFDPVPKASFNAATVQQAITILESLQVF